MERYYNHYSQTGGGLYFRGSQYHNQQGTGFAGIFRSLARFVTPLFKPVAKSLAMEGLNMGQKMYRDLKAGESFKSSLQKNSKEAGGNILNKLASGIINPQTGSGIRRRIIKRRKSQISYRKATKKRKRTKLDFLD